jgi:hypothetical protein
MCLADNLCFLQEQNYFHLLGAFRYLYQRMFLFLNSDYYQTGCSQRTTVVHDLRQHSGGFEERSQRRYIHPR